MSLQLPYHFGPNLKQRFRDSLTGAMVAVVAWIGLSYLLEIYVQHFESLDKTYGPLGAAIGLYVWFYLSGLAICSGEKSISCVASYDITEFGSRPNRSTLRSTI